MKGKIDQLLKLNQNVTPLTVFMESYNKSIPESFPRASIKSLKYFRTLYPSLFKKGDKWSIDKHRKRFMDWRTSYSDSQIP